MSETTAVETPAGGLRELIGPARGQVAELVVLSVAVTATYVLQGVLIARVFGLVIADQPLAGAVTLLIGVVVAQLARSVALIAREVVGARAAARVKDDLRHRLYAKLLELGPGEVRRRRTGELQSVLVDVVEKVEPYVARFVPQAVAAVVAALAIAIYLITLDPLVGLVVVACGAIVPLVPAASERLVRSRMEPWWRSYRGLYAENLDAVQGMTTLKLFGSAGRRGRELHDKAETFCTESIRLTAIVVVYVGVVGALVGVGTALSVGLGALRRADGLLATADLLVILLLTRECFRPLRQLQEAYHSAAPARTAATTVFGLLATAPAVRDPANPVRAEALAVPPSITFEDVHFTYPGRETEALRGLDLHVAPGERIALVGRSGAGKTTAVALVLRWYDPSAGRVLIDGTDVRDLALADLRAQVALVSQDTYLFHGTVRDNVALARPDATGSELQAALAAAQADFVHALPQGLDTVVGERGMKLSGGERQRLAIARALLVDAPVLVLDEATSSLDAANETGLTAALQAVSAGRTTITIAHRLSTVREADRIVVIADGRVVESGPRADLLAGGGAFAQLTQAGTAQR